MRRGLLQELREEGRDASGLACGSLCLEAAREIERLSTLVKRLQGAGQGWLHVKRGSTYVEVARGLSQNADPKHDMVPKVYYVAEDGSWWDRPVAEFEDGRFVPVEP